ncbi:DUF721 domain-containing protein [Candidatus Falkowbacteria bacterium]|nr:DUF721 domain-containing protein [Candidatus Falkowbacteria bacterium]
MAEQLGSIMKNLMAGTNIAKQVQKALIVEFANELINEFWGKCGGRQAKAISVKNGLLKIECQNSIIAQEIALKKNKFIERINEKFGAAAVLKIKTTLKAVADSSAL